MQNLKIGIVGLGLIGGSILKCLSKKGFYTIAVSNSSCDEARAWANVCSSEYFVLKEADVVFVCSEMSKVLSVLDKLENVLDKKTIVADVSSLKDFVFEKPRPYKFVGSHPMAGTEFSGFENSFEALFEGAKWVLTEENEVLEYLISQMGAKVVIMDSKEHDKSVALISHFPALLAQALFSAAEDNENAKILAASGFRDMTRLVMSNPALTNDMLELNRKNIDLALENTLKALEGLKKLSTDERIETFSKNAQNRTRMYADGKNVL